MVICLVAVMMMTMMMTGSCEGPFLDDSSQKKSMACFYRGWGMRRDLDWFDTHMKVSYIKYSQEPLLVTAAPPSPTVLI